VIASFDRRQCAQLVGDYHFIALCSFRQPICFDDCLLFCAEDGVLLMYSSSVGTVRCDHRVSFRPPWIRRCISFRGFRIFPGLFLCGLTSVPFASCPFGNIAESQTSCEYFT
jgi:hypothetical protein